MSDPTQGEVKRRVIFHVVARDTKGESKISHGAFTSEEAARWVAAKHISLNTGTIYIETITLYEEPNV